MRFEELTPEQRQRLLAGDVKNHMAGTGAIFSPWYGLDLCYQQGYLCRCVPKGPVTRIAHMQDLFGKTDEQIWKLVMK